MVRPRHADLSRARARALGVLTIALLALTVFSFAWYLLVPRVDGIEDEAAIAQVRDANRSASFQEATDQGPSSLLGAEASLEGLLSGESLQGEA